MNKHIKNIVFVAICLLAASLEAKAQSGTYYTVRDFEVWTGASIKYKMNKKTSVSLEQQLRLKDDASTVDMFFTEMGLNRKIGEHFSVALGTRYIRKNDTEGKKQGYENQFRWNGDLAYQHNISRLSLVYRLRYQSRNQIGVDDVNNTTWRFKVGTEYNIKKWAFDPKFAAEIFNGVSSSEGFNKLRLTAGTSYKMKNIGEISLYYRMEKELLGLYPMTTNIAGFNYKYTLKNKKKNDK